MVNRDYIFLLYEVHVPLAEFFLGGGRDGITTEAALGDHKDETDDPEAKDQLAVVSISAIID